MLRPSPNHGTQRLPNDDDDDDEVKTKETEQACFRVGQGTRTSFQTVRNNKQQTPHVKKRVSVCVVTVGE